MEGLLKRKGIIITTSNEPVIAEEPEARPPTAKPYRKRAVSARKRAFRPKTAPAVRAGTNNEDDFLFDPPNVYCNIFDHDANTIYNIIKATRTELLKKEHVDTEVIYENTVTIETGEINGLILGILTAKERLQKLKESKKPNTPVPVKRKAFKTISQKIN